MTVANVADMTDEELRSEYVALMANARAMGAQSVDEALVMLLDDRGTSYSQSVCGEMSKRGIRGIAHEDGRYDYLCGSEWCRCSS